MTLLSNSAMKTHTLRFSSLPIIILGLLSFWPSMAIGQTDPATGELERLRNENRQLRKELADARQKSLVKQSTTERQARDTDDKKIVSERAAISENPPPLTFLDKVFLRKSVFDQDVLAPGQISGPAQITYAHPRNGADTYAIDAGLAATFITPQPGLWQIDWGIGADYHRNSETSAKKNLFQTGLIADAIFGNPALSDFVRAKANLSYKDDDIKDVRSIVGGIDVLPVIAGLWIDNYHRLGPAHWRWQPFLGLRYESVTDSGAAGKDGDRLLGRYGVEAQIFPFFDYVKRSVEVKATYTMWSDLSSSGVYSGNGWNGFLDADLTYWFNGGLSVNKEKVDLGVGVSYQNGDNPELNLAHIDLLTVSLKAKF
jgi:hypothetical protein